jgi:hypothetical protein
MELLRPNDRAQRPGPDAGRAADGGDDESRLIKLCPRSERGPVRWSDWLGVTLNRKIPDTESNNTWLCREVTPAMPQTFAPPPKTIAARDQEPAQR